MDKYEKDVALLSALETFDPKAFVGSEEWPQELCNFILALALAYNDFKDVIFAQALLATVRPPQIERPTPAVGHYAGLYHHLTRNLAGLLHELTNLIQKHVTLMEHPKFVALVRNLPGAARDAWIAVVSAASEKPSGSAISMLLVRARNKIAFHYDAHEIAKGYAGAFLEPDIKEPYVSRGASMAVSRFYFADAAASVYMRDVTDVTTADEFFSAASPLLNQINHALRELVTRFINARGFGWRTPAA